MADLKENERLRALELYLNSTCTQAAIAREVGVSERTISVWATEDNWKAIKKARFHSPRVEEQRL
jgi:uncharacterized protein YjcR